MSHEYHLADIQALIKQIQKEYLKIYTVFATITVTKYIQIERVDEVNYHDKFAKLDKAFHEVFGKNMRKPLIFKTNEY